MSLGATIAAGDASQQVQFAAGVFQRAASGMAVVLLDGVEIPMRTTQWPQPGEDVYVACLAGTWVVLGPASPKARTGRVTSVLTGAAVVEYPEGSGVTASLLTPSGMTPVVGDKVLIDWANGGVIVQRYSTQQETLPGAPPAPPAAQPQTAVFRAAWSGSVTNAGYWTAGSDVYAVVRGGGRGAWGYDSIKGAVPAGKTIQRARLFLPLTKLGSALTLGYHGNAAPSGPVTLSGGVAHTPVAGWQEIPASLAQQLIGGGPAQGLAIEGGSGTVVAGVGRDGMSGSLELTWV